MKNLSSDTEPFPPSEAAALSIAGARRGIRARGEISVPTHPSWEQALSEPARRHAGVSYVELSDVAFVDVAAVTALLEPARRYATHLADDHARTRAHNAIEHATTQLNPTTGPPPTVCVSWPRPPTTSPATPPRPHRTTPGSGPDGRARPAAPPSGRPRIATPAVDGGRATLRSRRRLPQWSGLALCDLRGPSPERLGAAHRAGWGRSGIITA
ncbi:hypothetical protein FNX48_000045 [Streptomyces sp. IF17]|nr:hypothetical protein [Streptomyces alkaliphilus]